MTVGIEYKAIKPKAWDAKFPRLEMLGELRKIGRELKKDLDATAATWSKKPTFTKPEVHLRRAAAEAVVIVGTDDENWVRLNAGTRPHIISPVRRRTLAFRPGYRAKTRPRVLKSFPGGKFGSHVVRHQVYHPGVEARRWVATAKRKYDPVLLLRINAALARGVARGMR